jgi:quercetin dioxygenase-like cupin family protein
MVGGEHREVGEKNVVYAPAGVEHSVKNAGSATVTLLVLMTPHPNYVSKKH